MTSRQFALALARDCITGLVVLATILAAITAGYGLLVAITAFFITPLLMAGWIVIAFIRTPRQASPDVQEQDAQRSLRVVRTVNSEPQPSAAPAIDLFTREPVA